MRYIHSGNSTLALRRYKRQISMIMIGILGIGFLTTAGLTAKKYIAYDSLSKQIVAVEDTKRETVQKVIDIKDELELNQFYRILADEEGNLPQERMPVYFDNINVVKYLNQKPETIMFEQVKLNDVQLILVGQATSFDELKDYVAKMKADKIFAQVKVVDVQYATFEKIAYFELHIGKNTGLPTEVK